MTKYMADSQGTYQGIKDAAKSAYSLNDLFETSNSVLTIV